MSINSLVAFLFFAMFATGTRAFGQETNDKVQNQRTIAPEPSFEVATIKPDPSGVHGLIQGLTITGRMLRVKNASVLDLIGFAFDVQLRQVVNAPAWAGDDRYDVEGVADREGPLARHEVETMMQKLLADRFAFKYHDEKRDMPAFVLDDQKSGWKLAATKSGGPLPQFSMRPEPEGLTVHVVNATVDDFTSFLQMVVLDRPVVNNTGLTGHYDFDVTFTPDDSQFGGHAPKSQNPSEGGSVAPNLFEAIRQQIGLRLKAERAAVPVIVIDHVDRPSAN